MRRLHRAFRARRPARAVAPLAGLAEHEDVLGDLHDGGRDLIFRWQHRHLLLRCLRRRARNDLPEHDIETRLERRDIRVRLSRVPRIRVEVKLRLTIRRVQLEPLRDRQGLAVDRRHPHEGEVGVLHQLALVEGAGSVEDVLDLGVQLLCWAVVARPVCFTEDPNPGVLRCCRGCHCCFLSIARFALAFVAAISVKKRALLRQIGSKSLPVRSFSEGGLVSLKLFLVILVKEHKKLVYIITNIQHFVKVKTPEFNPQVQHSLLVMDSTSQGVFLAES